jgi:hypothetical protein
MANYTQHEANYYRKRNRAINKAAKVHGVDPKIIRAGMKKDAVVAEEHKAAVRLAKEIWYRYRRQYAIQQAKTVEVPAEPEA